MCELTVYAVRGESREKLMEGVVRLMVQDGLVRMEGIFGDAQEVEGRLAEVDIMAQSASVIVL
jgi:predicted RNA-binding protein